MKKRIIFFILILAFFISCEEKLEPMPPLEVTILPIANVTTYSVLISWSEYDGDDFGRYEVYFKKSVDKEFKLYSTVNDMKVLSAIVSGLVPNTAYTFYVKILSTNGNFSDSQQFSITTLNDNPSGIKIIKVEGIGSNLMRVYWTKYRDSYVVEFGKYELYYSRDPVFIDSSGTLAFSTTLINDTTVIVNNLVEKTNYYFRVRVYNKFDKYAVSNIISAITTKSPPDAPYLFKTYDMTETSVKLRWKISTDTDFAGYEVHLDRNMGFVPGLKTKIKEISLEATTEYQITNLEKYSEYFVKILVFDVEGLSSVSPEWGFTATNGGGPVPVTLLTPEIYSKMVVLYWTPSMSRYFQAYDIHKSKTPNFTPTEITAVGSAKNISTTSFGVINLNSNSTYYFKVVLYNQMGGSSVSNELKVTTLL